MSVAQKNEDLASHNLGSDPFDGPTLPMSTPNAKGRIGRAGDMASSAGEGSSDSEHRIKRRLRAAAEKADAASEMPISSRSRGVIIGEVRMEAVAAEADASRAKAKAVAMALEDAKAKAAAEAKRVEEAKAAKIAADAKAAAEEAAERAAHEERARRYGEQKRQRHLASGPVALKKFNEHGRAARATMRPRLCHGQLAGAARRGGAAARRRRVARAVYGMYGRMVSAHRIAVRIAIPDDALCEARPRVCMALQS